MADKVIRALEDQWEGNRYKGNDTDDADGGWSRDIDTLAKMSTIVKSHMGAEKKAPIDVTKLSDEELEKLAGE